MIRTLFSSVFLFLSLSIAGDSHKTLQILTQAPNGKTVVHREILSECLELPSEKSLMASTSAKSMYLKHILGDSLKKQDVKVYQAKVEIPYRIRRKVLFIVSSNTLEKGKPEYREETESIMMSKNFQSQNGDSDFYAGLSKREYYFNSSQKAEASALKRANIWLKSQESLSCKD